MAYHQDRFEDFSLMIYKNESLLALFPANRVNNVVYSHQGLTYGDLIYLDILDFNTRQTICKMLLDHLSRHHIKSIIIKTLPEFYHSDLFSKTSCFQSIKKVSVIKKNRVLAIDYNGNFKIHKTKVKRYKKIESSGFNIRQNESEFEVFWNSILIPRLKEKHNSQPVHSLSEILFLHHKFENEIIQYTIYQEDELLAGITIFKKGKVVKSQYGMASVNGEKLNALDMLFVYLIYKCQDEGIEYFSMGTVNNDSKIGYSEGMLKQKQELGCSMYSQDILKVILHD